MDGTWDSVTNDFNQLDCFLSSAVNEDDFNSNSMDGDFVTNNKVVVQSMSTFSNPTRQQSTFSMDEDSLLRDSFDLSTVDVSNVATAFLQEAIQEEHPHLLNVGQHNNLNSSRSTNSSINCDNSESMEDLRLELREMTTPDIMPNVGDMDQMNIMEDDMEVEQQSSSQTIADDLMEDVQPMRRRGRLPKLRVADEEIPPPEPRPRRKAALKNEVEKEKEKAKEKEEKEEKKEEKEVQPKRRGRPRKHLKSDASSSIGETPPTTTPVSDEPAQQASVKRRGRPRKDAVQIAEQPKTTASSSPDPGADRSLVSPTPSVASSSTSSSRGRKRKTPVVDNIKEKSVPTEVLSPAPVLPSALPTATANADGTKPCQVRLDRLTEDELLRWTGSTTPTVWLPNANTDDLEVTISLEPSENSVEKGAPSSSSPVLPDAVDPPPAREKRKRGRQKKDSEILPSTTPPATKPTSLPPPSVPRVPRSTSSAKETKAKPAADSRCFSCNALLADKVDDCLNDLGPKSVYCSVACVDVQVAKANELHRNPDEFVIVMDQACGKLVGAPAAPRLRSLGQFLRSNANFCPVLAAKGPERTGVQKIEADSSTDRGKTNKLLSPQVDTIRINVRRAVKDSLYARAKDAEDLLLTSSEVKEVAVRIEEALFRHCRQSTSGRYKLWCKQFLTQLKDPNNQGLFRRVLSGELSPAKLASLEPADLGSKTLSDPPLVTLASVDTAAIFTSLKVENDATVTEEVIVSKSVAQKTVAGRQSRDALDDILGATRDTTNEHKSHLFDQNCGICTGKVEADTEKSERKKKKKSDAVPVKQKISGAGQDGKWTTPSFDAKVQVKEDDCGFEGFNELPIDSIAHGVAYEDDDRTDTAIDSYRYSPSDPLKWSPKTEDDPWNLDLTIWSGEVVMAGYFRFQSTLTAVSGVGAFGLRDILPAELQIVGRIHPIVVWEYIKNVKRTGGKDLIVLQANEPDDPDNKAQYEGLFNNMRAKGRYVVVGRLNQRIIKDFYLLPLSSYDSPPEELLPFEGVGLPAAGARRNLILCVVVRNRDDAPVPRPVPPPVPFGDAQPDEEVHFDNTEHNERNEEPSEALTLPPPSISPTMMPVALSQTAKDAENERVKNVIYGMFDQEPPSQPEYTVVRTWTVPGTKPGANGLDDAYDPAEDYFIPEHMMESEKRAPATPSEMASGPAQNVGDLIIAIHTVDDPAEIAGLVQNFMAERNLRPAEQEVVLKALTNKVSQEKARRGTDTPTSSTAAVSPPRNKNKVSVPKLIPTDEPDDIQLDQPAMSFMSEDVPPAFLTGDWRAPPRAVPRPAPRASAAKGGRKNDDDMDIEDGEICSDRETPNEERPSRQPPSTELGHLLLPPPPPPPDLQHKRPPPRQMPLVAEEADGHQPVVAPSARQPKRPSRPWDNVDFFQQSSYGGDSRAKNSGGQWNEGFEQDGHSAGGDASVSASASSHHYESNEYVNEAPSQAGWNGADQPPVRPPWPRGHARPPHLSPPFPRPPFRGRGAPVFGRGMQPSPYRHPPQPPMRPPTFNRAPFPFRPRGGPPGFNRPPFRGGPSRFRPPPPPNFYENY